MNQTGFDNLVNKLENFIKKFYVNELLKGLILFVALGLGLYLVIVGLEAFGQFGTSVRTALFYTSIFGFILVFSRYIAYPLVKLAKIGRIISHSEAAQLIGQHFPNVNDKLINTLQLQADGEKRDDSLLLASIDKRVIELSPIPFTTAIDLKENKKYVKFLLPPLLVLVILLFTNAKWLTEPTDRIINHSKAYVAPAPFEIILINEDLNVVSQEEITLRVKVKGNEIPNDMALIKDGTKYRMRKISKVEYEYKLRLDDATSFYFRAGSVTSKKYTINVLPRPSIENLEIILNYPDYTGRTDEVIAGAGDLDVPEGTLAKWVFNTKNVSALSYRGTFLDTTIRAGMDQNVEIHRSLKSSELYTVLTQNEFISNTDSTQYSIQVRKDQYPSIKVSEEADTTNSSVRYFSGQISDDYGFTGLSFIINYKSGKKKGKREVKAVGFNPSAVSEKFMFFWNIDQLGLDPGDEISYYFTVSDNDKVNGSKSSQSHSRVYKKETAEELQEKYEESNANTQSQMDQAMKEASELKKKMKELQNELSNSSKMSWQQKQKMESMLNRQEALQKKVEDLKKDFKKNNDKQEEFKELDEKLQEKRDQLEKLLDELMTPEMKEMMEELRKLMEEQNKDKVQDKLEEMNMSNEQMEKELERALEHFKQIQFQEKLDEAIEKSKELSEKQKELGEKLENKEISKEDAAKEQEKLDDLMEQVKEDVEDLKKKNEELEKKHDLDEAEEKMKEAEKEMEESKDELQKDKMKKSGSSQKQAGEKSEEMSEALQSMQTGDSPEQQEEDYDALRQLLENLIELSFGQEEIMEDIVGLGKHDPQYFEVGKKQRKLMDDAEIIKDSLFALSKRVIEIAPIVNKEIGEINYYMKKVLEDIGERRTNPARSKQQYIMTSTNNLALLLDEALKQMQSNMQAQSMMSGSGSCSKPGGKGKGKPSNMPSIQKMQEELAKQLEKMKNGQKKGPGEGKKPGGEKPGGMTPGGKQGEGSSGMPGENGQQSEQLAKLAAQQAALREQIKRIKQELNQDGSGSGNGLNKVIEEMEKTEEDIIYDRITQQTLNRQKDILTRLLEHERADRERDWDEKRESKESKNEEFSNPERYLEYKRKKQKELELLKTIPPDLRKYYKNKVNTYFNNVE